MKIMLVKRTNLLSSKAKAYTQNANSIAVNKLEPEQLIFTSKR